MNVNRPQTLFAVALVGGALAIAGCGDSDSGPSADDASADYNSIDRSIQSFGTQLAQALSAASTKTDAQLGDQFDGLSDKSNRLLTEVKNLEVPEDLKSDKDALVSAFDDGVQDIEDIAAAVSSSDADAARTAATKLIRDSEAIRDSRAQLKAALADATK